MPEPSAILIPKQNSAYVEIAKVGSSSIKAFIAALLEIPLKDGDPHAAELPAARLADLPSDCFVFAIDFRRFYAQATAEAVAKRYAEDIELFGYRRDAP